MEVILIAGVLTILMLVVMQVGRGDFEMPSFDPFGLWIECETSRIDFEFKCMLAIGVAAVVLLSLYVYLKAVSQPVAQSESSPVVIAQK
jgi:hypothetical protein